MQSEQGLGDTLQFCRMRLGRGSRSHGSARSTAAARGFDGNSEESPECGSGDEFLNAILHPVDEPAAAFHTTYRPYRTCSLSQELRRQVGLLERDSGERQDRGSVCVVGRVRAGHPDPCGWMVAETCLGAFACFESADIEFYSLQKGQPRSRNWRNSPPAVGTAPDQDFTHLLRDFSDTAALVEQMDLVVSVDTATAHLAGALGKPVWLLNRFDTVGDVDGPNRQSMVSVGEITAGTPGDWSASSAGCGWTLH